MFVRPFDRGVVDIVARHRRLHVGLGQHQARIAQPLPRPVALEPVIAADDVAAAVRDHEMGKAHEAVVADLDVVGVHVDRDRRALLRRQVDVVRDELAVVDQQVLAPAPDRGDRAVHRPREITVRELDHLSLRGQHHATGDAVAAEIDLGEVQPAEFPNARKVEQIAIAFETVEPRARTAVQGLRQGQRALGHVSGVDIDLAAHAAADDAAADLDGGDVGDVGQQVGLGGVVGAGTGRAARLPCRAGLRLDGAVLDHPAVREPLQRGGQIGQHQWLVQVHPAPAEVQRDVVGIAQQRLQRLLHAKRLVAEGVRIGREIKAPQQRDARRGRGGDAALETNAAVDRQIARNEEGPCGHDDGPACRGLIRGQERGTVVRDPVTHRPEIAHVDPVQQRRDKGRGDVVDADRFDPERPAIGAHQVQTEMPIDRARAPRHVHAWTVAHADDGADLDHLAIVAQRDRGAVGDQPRDGIARPVARPARDAHAGQRPRHDLDPRRHAQIDAGDHRRLSHEAQAGGGLLLDDLEAGAEILIGGDDAGIARVAPGRTARGAIAARPDTKSRPEGGWRQQKPVGDRNVHRLSLPYRHGGRVREDPP